MARCDQPRDGSHRGLVVAALFLLASTACSRSTPFDPSTVDLVGRWTFAMDMQPDPSITPPGIDNACLVRGAPIDVFVDAGTGDHLGLWQAGGTMQCRNQGIWGSAVPYNPGALFTVTRTGDSVTLRVPNGQVAFAGTLSSASRMSGTINPIGWQGQVGTWNATR